MPHPKRPVQDDPEPKKPSDHEDNLAFFLLRQPGRLHLRSETFCPRLTTGLAFSLIGKSFVKATGSLALRGCSTVFASCDVAIPAEHPSFINVIRSQEDPEVKTLFRRYILKGPEWNFIKLSINNNNWLTSNNKSGSLTGNHFIREALHG